MCGCRLVVEIIGQELVLGATPLEHHTGHRDTKTGPDVPRHPHQALSHTDAIGAEHPGVEIGERRVGSEHANPVTRNVNDDQAYGRHRSD